MHEHSGSVDDLGRLEPTPGLPKERSSPDGWLLRSAILEMADLVVEQMQAIERLTEETQELRSKVAQLEEVRRDGR